MKLSLVIKAFIRTLELLCLQLFFPQDLSSKFSTFFGLSFASMLLYFNLCASNQQSSTLTGPLSQWILISCATYYLTSSFNQVSFASPIPPSGGVQISNGTNLFILHEGHYILAFIIVSCVLMIFCMFMRFSTIYCQCICCTLLIMLLQNFIFLFSLSKTKSRI